MKPNYQSTKISCYLGSATQAVINNLSPLLFVIFSRQFGLALSQLTILITLNFITQLLVDLAAAKFADKVGYRTLVCAAHFLASAGLIMLGTLPFLIPNTYAALIIATIVNALGGGLLEVIVSPIIEALPEEENKKAASMSFLHSFYCWGSVAVVLFSTLFLWIAGTSRWPLLPVLWSILPFVNAISFTKVPLKTLNEDSGLETVPLSKLFNKKAFLFLFLLMVCSGASEQAMSQWASYFAEAGLSVNKTVGDLMGPCMFAVFMGSARVFFGLKSTVINIEKAMMGCGALCIASYLLASLSPWPIVSLLGCSLCGFSVGVMWPGTFSLAAKYYPEGGTAMFAILALAGDLGCTLGPALVGTISGTIQVGNDTIFGSNPQSAALKIGLLCAIVFPLLLMAGTGAIKRYTSGKA